MLRMIVFEYFLEDVGPELLVEVAEGHLRFSIELFQKEMEECAVGAGGRGIIVD